MRIFKNSFKALQDKIKQALSTARMVDLWNDEIDMYREELPILFPAIFIEFLPVEWQTIGTGKTQHGNGTIKIHIAQNIISDSGAIDGNDLPAVQDALIRFDLIQDVHDILQGFKVAYFAPLERIGTTIDHNHDGIILDVIEYSTIFFDVSTSTVNDLYNQNAIITDVEIDPNGIPEIAPNNTGGFIVQM